MSVHILASALDAGIFLLDWDGKLILRGPDPTFPTLWQPMSRSDATALRAGLDEYLATP